MHSPTNPSAPAARPRPRASLPAPALLVGALLLAGCGRADDAPGPARDGRLTALPIAPDSVTASGISAGGYMAVQLHVALSNLVHGAGVFAAGPWYCAQNSLSQALGPCMKGEGDIDTDTLVALASRLALDGEIDPIANLHDDRVYIWRGAADPFVGKPVVDALQDFYATLVDPQAIERVELPGAGHTFPSDQAGLTACDVTEKPFVGSCGFNGARLMLTHLYGPIEAAAPAEPAGTLAQFDQQPYAEQSGSKGLAARGWLYVPPGCDKPGADGSRSCRLHVALHGCKQGASYVGEDFMRKSGYLAAADAGRVVVLFPQVQPSFQPLNPNGCWDWWGYEGENYMTRSGPQVAALAAMIEDLLGGPSQVQ
jgi:poly(3-hydroxybutyrate) depolymerase